MWSRLVCPTATARPADPLRPTRGAARARSRDRTLSLTERETGVCRLRRPGPAPGADRAVHVTVLASQSTMLKVRMIMVHTHARYCDASRGEHMIKRRRERDRRDAMHRRSRALRQVEVPRSVGASRGPHPQGHVDRVSHTQAAATSEQGRCTLICAAALLLCTVRDTAFSLSLTHSLTLSFWLHSSASRSTPHT